MPSKSVNCLKLDSIYCLNCSFAFASLRAFASATFAFHIATAYPVVFVGLALFACDYHRF